MLGCLVLSVLIASCSSTAYLVYQDDTYTIEKDEKYTTLKLLSGENNTFVVITYDNSIEH